MPRYLYKCKFCGIEETVFHRMNETHTVCSVCELEDSMEKLFTNSFAVKNKTTQTEDKSQTVGTVTHEYIEKNRELLKTEQEKAKKETYEPS